MRSLAHRVALGPVAALVVVVAWLAAEPLAAAQGPSSDYAPLSLIDEVRFGLLAHSVEPSNAEDGVDVNLEVLFARPATRYDNPWLDVILRPRIHVGTSINTAGDTDQLYAGLTWDGKLTQKLSLELTFGGSLHDGPTGDGAADSYGCSLNFRESISLGYALDQRWTLYGTVAHMSNANLCDHNSGLTSVGVRLGYKLNK
ncbi:MAG: acyloxyacyl hydrolase [Hyphomicrobiaceae bacterium]|nr:acyloxyacyl hydrolase [Hyphomicrobiaceae bacterium]